MCDVLGIPQKSEKTERPANTSDFLGIKLDTCFMEAVLSDEKIHKVKLALEAWW